MVYTSLVKKFALIKNGYFEKVEFECLKLYF
jgi:hypothetical protein